MQTLTHPRAPTGFLNKSASPQLQSARPLHHFKIPYLLKSDTAMTAIAIWCNQENDSTPSLWVAADSRVTSPNRAILVEDAAKVIGLPIVCRSPGPTGFFSNIYYEHTIGYCFAGSTLMGQNSYLGFAPMLSNLISPTGYVPSMADIARHVLALLRLTFDEYKFRVGQGAVFEAAIFGFCHRNNKLSTYHFHPEMIDGTVQLTSTAYEGMRANEFAYLGDEGESMRANIARAFAGEATPGRPLSRAPRYVIQDRIDDETSESIGGDIQLGIADRFGFRPLTLCKPRAHGQSAAYMSYLGRELTDDIGYVGEAMVAITGMI